MARFLAADFRIFLLAMSPTTGPVSVRDVVRSLIILAQVLCAFSAPTVSTTTPSHASDPACLGTGHEVPNLDRPLP